MNQQISHIGRRLFGICLPLLALSFSIQASADTSLVSPTPGSYCPSSDILVIVAEELSASLDLAMHSRAALINKNQKMAIRDLISTGTTLHLAASRGASARTILLIDAIIQAKSNENYQEVLTWLPLLQTSLRTLPYDETTNAASDLIGRAEDIMQGDNKGDPMVVLKKARHMLACDGLDLPLQEAIASQNKLMNTLRQNTKSSSYDVLIDSLHSALRYTLQSNEK